MKKSLLLFLSSLTALFASAESEMLATIDGMTSTMSNGIITLSIDKSGRANKLYHPDNGSSTNILGSSGIYFDYTADKNRALTPDKVEIVRLTDDYAEILYTNTTGDLRFSQGYILRKGVSGVYTYVIANGTPTSSSVKVKEVRVCTRLASTFLNGYVDDSMQGLIPSNSEMKTAEKKENTIQDATYRMADGSIYTKYNWAQFIDSDSVHGLMNDKVGVWNIPCSYEWLNGGPMRQELTVHATGKSPITIQMIQGEHLGGAAQAYNDGESQIFGPFFIYVNSAPTKEEMIADAKAKAHEQKGEWPFKWFENALYPLDRATVSGRIVLPDNFKDTRLKVVLAEPGVELIRQGKKYIFWSETDAEGNFSIPNVRKGDYALRAYALSGIITDELEVEGISVDDAEIDLGAIDWTSPSRAENLIWNIGENNRRADGFNMSDAPRAYGLWESVPANLTYTVGSSDTARDWYFAQCHNGTWTVNFNLDDSYEGDVHLTASVAATTNKPSVAVKVNGESRTTWSFPNNDAAIYRSATQAGRHVVKTCSFPASLLKKGSNTISFTMSGISKNGGVMWDCVKLEGTRGQSSGIGSVITDPAAEGDYQLYTPAGQKVGTFDSLENLDLPSGIYIYRRGADAGKIRL